MMELKVITIISLNGEPFHVTGGESVEEVVGLLEQSIKLIKVDEVEHVKEEE